jgi:two-component sensor histidine kinase
LFIMPLNPSNLFKLRLRGFVRVFAGPSSSCCFGLLLTFWFLGTARLQSQDVSKSDGLLESIHSNAIVVERNDPEVISNRLDSLTERGSYNFSDMGSWIWGAETLDRQTCRFWKSFEIPEGSKVTRARLRITGDNEYVLYLDGCELGRDAEWRHLYEYDITALLAPGRHILAVEDYNSSREAGMILGLRIGLADGRVVSVKSDQSWVVGADGVPGWQPVRDWQEMDSPPVSWPPATVIAVCGKGPWAVSPWFIDIVPPLKPVVIPFWQRGWFQISVLGVLLFMLVTTIMVISKLALRTKEQRLLQRERARIARDIHDDLGMRMTHLVLDGEVMQKELPADSNLRARVNQICEDTRATLSSMDEILWAINPRRDNLHEFTTYVCNYAQTFLKNTGIRCVLDVDAEISAAAFNLPLRRNLLLAVKEALNNAAKHAQATELWLQIHWQGNRVIVVVEDNGRGFDTEQANAARNGLNNMKERMTDLGGRCRVASELGKGCRVEFSVPIVHQSWLPFGKKRLPETNRQKSNQNQPSRAADTRPDEPIQPA